MHALVFGPVDDTQDTQLSVKPLRHCASGSRIWTTIRDSLHGHFVLMLWSSSGTSLTGRCLNQITPTRGFLPP